MQDAHIKTMKKSAIDKTVLKKLDIVRSRVKSRLKEVQDKIPSSLRDLRNLKYKESCADIKLESFMTHWMQIFQDEV